MSTVARSGFNQIDVSMALRASLMHENDDLPFFSYFSPYCLLCPSLFPADVCDKIVKVNCRHDKVKKPV